MDKKEFDEKFEKLYLKTELNMKRYIDMDKFNAIYDFLYFREEMIHEGEEVLVKYQRRSKVLEIYLQMDKNDVDFFLAKNLKEGLDSNAEASDKISREISMQHFN